MSNDQIIEECSNEDDQGSSSLKKQKPCTYGSSETNKTNTNIKDEELLVTLSEPMLTHSKHTNSMEQ